MNKARMFWIDVRCEKTTATSRALFDDAFLIQTERRGLSEPVAGYLMRQRERRTGDNGAGMKSMTSPPDLCCVEFDYPDLLSLKLLKKIRLRYPKLPILMLTEYHSEALAIWALRLHVWDLLVKPISAEEAADVAQAIATFKAEHQPGTSLFDRPNANCLVPEALRLQPSPSADDSLRPGLQFINDHLSEKITEKQIAEVCGLGPFTFSRSFKKRMGLTFQEYLQQCRIGEAMRLLRHPSASITDVAFLAGFRDLSYFSKVFKRVVGCAPSEFRGRSRGVPQCSITQGSKDQPYMTAPPPSY